MMGIHVIQQQLNGTNKQVEGNNADAGRGFPIMNLISHPNLTYVCETQTQHFSVSIIPE